jgi:hypothetical protein
MFIIQFIAAASQTLSVLINIRAITYHMLSSTDVEPQGVLLAINNPDQDFV